MGAFYALFVMYCYYVCRKYEQKELKEKTGMVYSSCLHTIVLLFYIYIETGWIQLRRYNLQQLNNSTNMLR